MLNLKRLVFRCSLMVAVLVPWTASASPQPRTAIVAYASTPIFSVSTEAADLALSLATWWFVKAAWVVPVGGATVFLTIFFVQVTRSRYSRTSIQKQLPLLIGACLGVGLAEIVQPTGSVGLRLSWLGFLVIAALLLRHLWGGRTPP
jgi:hypothetical protein